jgi:hypothetical protein
VIQAARPEDAKGQSFGELPASLGTASKGAGIEHFRRKNLRARRRGGVDDDALPLQRSNRS